MLARIGAKVDLASSCRLSVVSNLHADRGTKLNDLISEELTLEEVERIKSKPVLKFLRLRLVN